MTAEGWVVTIAAALAAVVLVWLYNRLVADRNLVRQGFADIDVQLKRRADLVPQLVEAVRGYAAYEKALLTAVTELRANALHDERGGEGGAMRAMLGALFFLAALGAQAAERVLDLHGDIRIAASGELTVTETIAVQVEGREIKRGILRDFPTDYTDRLGNKVRVPFEVLSVKRNSLSEPYGTERLANGVRIRIGRADLPLSPGRHVYEISYRTARQVGHFEQHDELYWNVNGTGWTFAMDHVSAEVTLPIPVQPSQMKLEAYTGLQGARGRSYTSSARDGGAVFVTSRALGPGEGLTIVVGFPKGIVTPPTAGQRARWFLGDNSGVAAGIASLLALLGVLYWSWNAAGRDPRVGPRYPRYDGPPGIGPAGVRYVDRMGYDNRCFAAGLLGLGQRGYLKIRTDGSQYTVERTGASAEWLPGEKWLSGTLLGNGTSISIGREHNPVVGEAHKSLRRALELHFGRLFSKNYDSLFIAAAIGLLGGVAMFEYAAPVFAMAVYALAAVVALVLFARWLPAYSTEGRKLQDAIEGLRQYLTVAEKDDLARMQAPPQTKEEFAKLLPYAVALDVEKTWADRFATLLGAAAVGQAVSSYYQDSSESAFGSSDFGTFTTSLSSMDSTIAAASTPPASSSGFSDSGSSSSGSSGGNGGGSSGGGGGGGGGSGW